MTMVLSNGMCRCCASEGTFKDVKSKYQWMGEEEVYADMLKDCLNITLTEECEDGGICEVCITQLRNAANFKKQVLNTEEQLKHVIGQKTSKPAVEEIIKMEEANDYADEAEGFDHFDDGDDLSDPDYTLGVKEEKEIKNELRPKRRAVKATASSSSAKGSEPKTLAKPAKRINVALKKLEETAFINVETETNDYPVIKRVPAKGVRGALIKHLVNMRQILLCSNATPIRNHDILGYMCWWCPAQFPIPADLKRHTIATHTEEEKSKFSSSYITSYAIKLDITSLQCLLCNEEIVTPEQLLEHLQSIHDKEVYPNIEKRIFPFKFNNDELSCFFCSQSFLKFKILQEHMNSHYRNFVCDICDAGFVNKTYCSRHRRIHSLGIFKCEQCPKVYHSVVNLRAHVRNRHRDNVIKYKCRHCNERFLTYPAQQLHLSQAHGVALIYKCEACHRTFLTHGELNHHMKYYHMMERKFKCELCDKGFSIKQHLSDHMVTHTKEKTFQCEVCLKMFGTKRYLSRHILNTHEAVNDVKCPYCPSYLRKRHLKRHIVSKHRNLI